jgi:hypothetical protein
MTRTLVAFAVVALLVGTLVGCTSYDSASSQEANGTYDASKTSGDVPNAITLGQFKGTQIGTTYDDLVATYGPPADKQVYNASGFNSVTVYYNDVTDDPDFPMAQYQFSFENGRLDSKANY